jgi:hypothetical protein
MKSELIATHKINLNQPITERLTMAANEIHPKDQQMIEEIENNIKENFTFKPVNFFFIHQKNYFFFPLYIPLVYKPK